jgi:hypothetical protein
MEEYMSVWDRFASYINYVVGDGDRVRFWHDSRCDDYALKELYPDLYSIAIDKDASVYYSLEQMVGGGPSSWNVKFVDGCDWELELVKSFLTSFTPIFQVEVPKII